MLKKGISDFNYDYQAYNDYLGEIEGYHSKEEKVNTTPNKGEDNNKK